MNVIGIEIDRENGRVIGADTPPANMDADALIKRMIPPAALMEMYIDCLGGDGLEQEKVREYGRRSGIVPAF